MCCWWELVTPFPLMVLKAERKVVDRKCVEFSWKRCPSEMLVEVVQHQLIHVETWLVVCAPRRTTGTGTMSEGSDDNLCLTSSLVYFLTELHG